MNCKQCEKAISEKRIRKGALFCASICRARWVREEWRRKNVTHGPLSTSTVGALAELLVAHDLLSRGYEVFRALSPAASCDLAILKGTRLIRVEVKTSYKSLAGAIYQPRVRRGTHDILALVFNRRDIVYQGLDL